MLIRQGIISKQVLIDEEDELKKIIAGLEVREMERERSEGYINRVKDFLEGYDEGKKAIDFATKKEMCGLLFKNIKIAPAIGGSLPQKRISFFLFAPFNLLVLGVRFRRNLLRVSFRT